MKRRYFLGIDLGGTFIKAGVIDDEANILSKVSYATEREKGVDRVIERMCLASEKAIEEAGLSKSDIEAIGIGAPGTLNHKTGVILAPPNFPDWRNVPLRDRIGGYFNLPATLENDANAAAWGEFWAGAGKDVDSLVMLTLGTGIGGGIVIDGKLHRGSNDMAAEIGHIIINCDDRDCVCGQRGCVEAYASAMNMAKIAEELLKKEENSSSLLREYLERGEEITAKVIRDCLDKEDILAKRIWDQTCRYLAIIAINIANMLDPEMIVFGGGMAEAGEVLIDNIRRYFNEMRSFVFTGARTRIELARLGSDAGIIGAAGAAKLARDIGEI